MLNQTSGRLFVSHVSDDAALNVRLPARLPGQSSSAATTTLRGSGSSDRSMDGKGPTVPVIAVADVVLRVNGVVCTLEGPGVVELVEALSNDDDTTDDPTP